MTVQTANKPDQRGAARKKANAAKAQAIVAVKRGRDQYQLTRPRLDVAGSIAERTAVVSRVLPLQKNK
jgi:hypothetical protein